MTDGTLALALVVASAVTYLLLEALAWLSR